MSCGARRRRPCATATPCRRAAAAGAQRGAALRARGEGLGRPSGARPRPGRPPARVRNFEEHIARADAVDRRNAQLDRDLVREVKRRKDLHNALEFEGTHRRLFSEAHERQGRRARGLLRAQRQTGVVVKRPDRKPPQDRQHRVRPGVRGRGGAGRGLRGRQARAVVRRRLQRRIFAYGQRFRQDLHDGRRRRPVRDAVDLESWAVAASAGVIRGLRRSSAFLMKGALNSYEVELSMWLLERCATSSRTTGQEALFAFGVLSRNCVRATRGRTRGSVKCATLPR